MQVFRRTLEQHLIQIDTDKVIASTFLPAGGSLNGVRLTVEGTALTSQSVLIANLYGLTGFVVPLLDPDAAQTMDAIWDAQIPKDVEMSAGSYDLDSVATDTASEFEIGEVDVSGMLDANAGPLELLQIRQLLTFAGNGAKGFESGTPDTWLPTFRHVLNLKRKARVDVHSVVMFAFSAPQLGDTTTTVGTVPGETHMTLIQYITEALRLAAVDLIGLTEAGAESPYSDALAAIATFIEPDAVEVTGGAFGAPSWNVFAKATFDLTVPGSFALNGPITSEG